MADLSRAILVLTAPRPPKLPPLQASGWDESEHPRDPGGEGGGQFVPKDAGGGITPAQRKAREELRRQRELRQAKKGLKPAKTKHDVARQALRNADRVTTGTVKLGPGTKLYHVSYHGDAISQGGFKVSGNGESGPGVYLAPTDYVKDKYPERQLLEVTTTEPLRLLDRTTAEGERRFREIQDSVPGWYTSATTEQRLEAFRKAGYDGVRYDSFGDPEIVVHDPSKLKAVLIGAGWDESEHPRDPGGEGGGEFIPKGASAEGALTGDSAIAAWEKAYPAPIVSDDQAEAVSAYQGAWFAAINHKLRDPADFAQRMKDIAAGSRINAWDTVFNSRDATTRNVKLEDVPAEVEHLTGQLDRVLGKAPANMVAYRYNYGPSVAGPEAIGIIEDVFGPYDQLEQLVGKTITDPGFQSTTLDEAWVNKRLSGDADGILHRIYVPKGTRSSYLPALGASPNFDEEKELLLARGLKMKATNVARDGNKYTIDWEIVP